MYVGITQNETDKKVLNASGELVSLEWKRKGYTREQVARAVLKMIKKRKFKTVLTGLDGGHYVSPAPSYYHQQIVSRLLARLFTFVDQHKLGDVSVAPLDILLSNENVVQPDILFIATDRESIITPNNVQGAPNLLIEVLSENNRR